MSKSSKPKTPSTRSPKRAPNASATAADQTPALRLRRFLIIAAFGLFALLITLATLYLVFQGGSRREANSSLPDVAVKPFTSFEGDAIFPVGLALDSAGVIHAASFGTGRLYKLGMDGKSTPWLNNAALTAPTALAFAPDKSLYVVDFSNSDPNKGVGSIKRVTPDGEVSTYAAAQALTGLSFLSGLTFDSKGDLFVAATAHGEIWRFPASGAGAVWITLPRQIVGTAVPGVTAGSAYALPTALLYDTVGNALYVADIDSGRIYRIAVKADGSPDTPQTVAQVADKTIAGLTFDGQRNLIFSQWLKEDGLLNRIEPNGKITQLAQNFRAPVGLASSGDTVYVANSDLPGLLRQGVFSIFSGAKPPFTVDSVRFATRPATPAR